MFYAIIIFVILFIIFAVIQGGNNAKSIQETKEKLGVAGKQFIATGKYLYGHPDINLEFDGANFCRNNERLDLYQQTLNNFIGKANIPIVGIKNILIEDATTIEKRITVGRLLLAGPFALAWRKKDKKELAFLVIEWNDGKFDHETYFEFTGKNSMTTANSTRNALINMCK